MHLLNIVNYIRRSTPVVVLPAVFVLGYSAYFAAPLAAQQPAANAQTAPQQVAPYAKQYTDFAIQSTHRVEANLPEITRIAEVMTKRHLAGGAIGFVGGYYEGSGLTSELEGRSGGLINIGFDRVWTKDRTDAQKANDMAIIAWDNGPWPNDLEKMKALRDKGTFIIGFGPRAMPELAERIVATDAWLDSGIGAPEMMDDKTFMSRGRANLLVNMLNGWTLTGEFVAALTRQGKMPTMWKGYLYPDGRAWGDKYFQKQQFHDDYTIAPIPAGQIGKAYLVTMRGIISNFAQTQLPEVQKAAELIAAEAAAGRQTIVATSLHAPPTFTGKYEDKVWANALEMGSLDSYGKRTPDGALVLRLGYTGISTREIEVLEQKKQRVIFISSQSPIEGRQVPAGLPNFIDMGFAFGDAVVPIEGYPINILPPSGIMQVVAYESVNVEVLARLALQPARSTPAQ